MDISDQFLEIDFFLTENRLVAVLKEMAVAPVSSVEGDGITCQSRLGGISLPWQLEKGLFRKVSDNDWEATPKHNSVCCSRL